MAPLKMTSISIAQAMGESIVGYAKVAIRKNHNERYLVSIPVWVLGLPAPGVDTHILDGLFGVPAEKFFCLFGVRIVFGKIAWAPLTYFVGYGVSAGFFKGVEQL